MTSAAIYARVSSARQKKDETIGSQTAALREHAAQNRLEVPEEWVFEDEGHSGATLIRPGLEALRDLAAQGCVDVVLVYSPDRLARKFAYQALLLEEFARAGVRVEFIKNGARGDSPEDQLLVQFQGMFAEYEKAQLMERYRRGKAHRARTGSVNVLSGAPFGYRYQRKTDQAGAVYELIEHEAALVAELFRRYADDGASIADLARWLTAQGVPTRTGKHRWDRSVIWGMLRNPAYAGTAVFGKTMAIHEPAGLNRVARLQGRSTPRAIKTVDRPREEWTQIAVPAIVDQDTFARVQQRLEGNKRFAARNTKIPSLLQGLAACTACGYGYYRTSTTTTNKKIYYYRCLGSDDYRYEGGRVCRNQPVRADYLDTVVWDHITGLLADPALIRAEIDKRLDQARTCDPARSQRKRLDTALAKATASISAMIEALSEQLITIDELRTRMPHLRAREQNLRSQIDALDAQAADRDAYLKLADDIEGFLSRLHASAGTARTEERQKVLRLLVKDVLIGPEKITIRHRIPVRDTHPATGQRATELDTEGDHRRGYPLCWGRDRGTLGGSLFPRHNGPVRHLHRRFQPPRDVQQDPPLAGVVSDRLQKQGMRNGVEKGPDIKVQHPVLRPAPAAAYGQRVMGAAPRTVAVAVAVEDRLQFFLQQHCRRSLRHPVGRVGHTEQTHAFPMILRYLHAPHRTREIAPRAHPVPQLEQIVPQLLLEHADADRIHARRPGERAGPACRRRRHGGRAPGRRPGAPQGLRAPGVPGPGH